MTVLGRNGPRARRNPRRARGGIGGGHGVLAAVMLAPTLGILGLVVGYPIVKAASLSVTETSLLRPNDSEFVGFQNFINLFRDEIFWDSLGTTFVWTFGSVTASYLIGLALALALNERFLGSSLVRGLVLIPWVTPGVVVGLLFLFVYNSESGVINHLLNVFGIIESPVAWLGSTQTALASVMVANIWSQVPFYMLALLAGLSSLPEDLTEAARLDGASRWQRFSYITFPHLRGVTVVTTALMIIWNFNAFDLIWAMTQGGPITSTTTLSVFVYRVAFDSQNLGYAGAIGVVWMLILLIIAFFYIRAMENGQKS